MKKEQKTHIQINLAVVPAAGRGTRLLPATRSQPKEMLPVGRKPTIQHVVEELAGAGMKEVLLISGQGKRALEDHLDRHIGHSEESVQPWMNLHFFYARQSTPKGLADAISIAEPFTAGRPFVVALGDTIMLSHVRHPLLKRMIAAHEKYRPAATISVEAIPNPQHLSRYGIVAPVGKTGDEFFIKDIIEKPAPGKAPSNFAASGRYILEPAIFDAIRRTKPGLNGELWLTDSFRLLLKSKQQILCVCMNESERRLDIGNHLSYFQAFIEICLNDPEHGKEIREWVKQLLEE